MKERYIFFIGLGIGIVLTALVSIFSYNILSNKDIKRNDFIENPTTQVVTENIIETDTTQQQINSSKE